MSNRLSLSARVAHSPEKDALARCPRHLAECAIALMKDTPACSVDSIDEVAVSRLERLPLVTVRRVVLIWRRKRLGYPTASLIDAIVDCLDGGRIES